MRKFLFICALIAGIFSGYAQTEIDNFTVGPYDVDYNGPGDVKYRLRDNINLYEFFELRKDTTIITKNVEIPLQHAIQVSLNVGTGTTSPKEIGLEGVWKQRMAKNLYLGAGLSFNLACSTLESKVDKTALFEAGIPIRLEFSNPCRQKSSLYGSIGLMPTLYSTVINDEWKVVPEGDKTPDTKQKEEGPKKSGFMLTPSLEFGGYIPVGNIIMQVGVYGLYKINCTTSVSTIGKVFCGAKIGIVI